MAVLPHPGTEPPVQPRRDAATREEEIVALPGGRAQPQDHQARVGEAGHQPRRLAAAVASLQLDAPVGVEVAAADPAQAALVAYGP